MIQDLSIAAALFAALCIALEIGFRAGRRAAADASAVSAGQIGAIQGAIIGLLGLLLAFSFSAAGSRFLERQDLIVQEANAIGTATLRADLLDEPRRSELISALRRYTEHRVEVSARLRAGTTAADLAEFERLQAGIWSTAMAGISAKPSAMLGVLPPINDVIDIHSIRVAAGLKHIPYLVLGLLIACSILAIGAIGYGCGIGGRRRAPLTVSLTILVGASLWITFDLDHPRAGLLQLNDAPLKDLKFGPPAP